MIKQARILFVRSVKPQSWRFCKSPSFARLKMASSRIWKEEAVCRRLWAFWKTTILVDFYKLIVFVFWFSWSPSSNENIPVTISNGGHKILKKPSPAPVVKMPMADVQRPMKQEKPLKRAKCNKILSKIFVMTVTIKSKSIRLWSHYTRRGWE